MSSLHFCKFPENARYTLSKQPLGTWPCGTSLISSTKFPLHFLPNSAGWPQCHRFFLCQCRGFQQQRWGTKQNPQKQGPHDRHSGFSHIILGSCCNQSGAVPGALWPQPAALLLPLPALEQLLSAEHSPGMGWADTEDWRVNREWKLPWCYRRGAPCWASMNQSLKWVEVLKWTKIWKQNSQLPPLTITFKQVQSQSGQGTDKHVLGRLHILWGLSFHKFSI